VSLWDSTVREHTTQSPIDSALFLGLQCELARITLPQSDLIFTLSLSPYARALSVRKPQWGVLAELSLAL